MAKILATFLDGVKADLSQTASQPVQVYLPGPGPTGPTVSPGAGSESGLAAQERAAQAALRAQAQADVSAETPAARLASRKCQT